MNAKLTLIGGLAHFVATWLVSMFTGPLLHNGLLKSAYAATAGFWRPELMQDPPDMAALMPRWISLGLVFSLVIAALYGQVRPALAGQGWARGARYGLGIGVLLIATMWSWSGVFNLPDFIWGWWSAEALLMNVIGGAAVGWAADRWSPARS
jgi:hypothetical protein